MKNIILVKLINPTTPKIAHYTSQHRSTRIDWHTRIYSFKTHVSEYHGSFVAYRPFESIISFTTNSESYRPYKILFLFWQHRPPSSHKGLCNFLKVRGGAAATTKNQSVDQSSQEIASTDGRTNPLKTTSYQP